MDLGIKETKELIEAVGVIAVQAKKIVKDGVGAEDIAHLVELIKQFELLADGFKDLDLVDDEIKNLSQVEVIELISILFNMVKALKA